MKHLNETLTWNTYKTLKTLKCQQIWCLQSNHKNRNKQRKLRWIQAQQRALLQTLPGSNVYKLRQFGISRRKDMQQNHTFCVSLLLKILQNRNVLSPAPVTTLCPSGDIDSKKIPFVWKEQGNWQVNATESNSPLNSSVLWTYFRQTFKFQVRKDASTIKKHKPYE